MPDNEFKLETRFTDSRGIMFYTAIGLAVAGIIGIVLTMTTDVAARLAPMDPNYLTVLIPKAADGAEPLSLKTLEHQGKDKSLSIKGTVLNRATVPITGLLAIVDVNDKYTLPAETATVPIDPVELPPNAVGTFEVMILSDKELGGFSVRFRLPDDGPFVPHKDERTEPPQLLNR
jgi:hypothetical protein